MYSIDREELERQNAPKEIEFHPIGKWKRILLFLGDLLLNFFLTFFLLNVAVNPLAAVITKSDKRAAELKEAEKIRDDILYGNELLFYKDYESSKYDYDSNLKYTFKRWLSYYVLDDKQEEYGKDIENEVIYTYYHNIPDRVDDVTYLKIFSDENNIGKFFNINGSDIVLKEEIKEEVILAYIPNETLGKEGEKLYNNLSSFFAKLYRQVMNDIFIKDLTYEGHSFAEYQKKVQELATFDGWTVSICILIAFFLSWLILHIIYPLIAKNGHTITMSIMKVEKVGTNNLNFLSKVEYALCGIYSLLLEMGFLVLLPLTYGTGLAYALTYPLLSAFSLTSIVICIISLIVLLINSFNRTLSDLVSRSVIIEREDMDMLIYAKQNNK